MVVCTGFLVSLLLPAGTAETGKLGMHLILEPLTAYIPQKDS